MPGKTIASVVEDGLCVGCGTCAALCPREAIELRISTYRKIYMAEVTGRCTECGECLRVCPGKGIALRKVGRELFPLAKEHLIGRYVSCYTGFSGDPDERFSSSSGGFAPAILRVLFRLGEIDAAIATSPFECRRFLVEPIVINGEQEIAKSRGSKYCPVPVNVLLRRVLENEPRRYAFVGLPCHIHGLRLAQQAKPRLREWVPFAIGIFCGGMMGLQATYRILERSGISVSEVRALTYRGDGWPGFMMIKTRDGRVIRLPYPEYGRGLSHFEPDRCRLCADPVAELADISLGDAWLPRFRDDHIGRSVTILRSPSSERLFSRAIDMGIVEAEPISIQEVAESQKSNVSSKKDSMGARVVFSRAFLRKTPKYEQKFSFLPRSFVRESRVFAWRLLKNLGEKRRRLRCRESARLAGFAVGSSVSAR
jgi:coenzyme F420 hydrogenase subunit beta